MMNRIPTLHRFVLFCILTLMAVHELILFQLPGGFEWNSSSLHARTVFLLIAFLSIYLFFNVGKLLNSGFLTVVVLLWIVWVSIVIYRTTVADSFKSLVVDDFCWAHLWSFTYLFFYVFAKQNRQSFRFLTVFFSILAVILFLMFFGIVSTSSTALLNQIYYPLMLLPWLLSSNLAFIQYGSIIAMSSLVLISLKRTAFIDLVVSSIVFFLCHLKDKSRMRFLSLLPFAVGIGIFMLLFINVDSYYINQFSARITSAMEDGGGGRLDIYQETIKMFFDSSAGDKLFGHGVNSVVQETDGKLSAHNDWLEMGYDFGIGGGLLYLILHLALVTKAWNLFRQNSQYAAAFGASYTIFLTMSLTSHLILYPSFFLFITAFWGAVDGLTTETIAANRYPSRGSRSRNLPDIQGAKEIEC